MTTDAAALAVVQHQQRNQTPEVFDNYFIENKQCTATTQDK